MKRAAAVDSHDPLGQPGISMTMKAHDTLVCVVCDVTILLLDVPADAVRPACCGHAMRTVRPTPCSTPQPRGVGEGTSGGRSYIDETRGLVVRCTRSGRGVISCDNKPMTPLPADRWGLVNVHEGP